MVSELVTNSVKHAGLRDQEIVTVTVQSSWDRMRVEVADGGLGFEPDLPPQPGDTSGWGLFLVERMADRWGVDPLARGVRVWFELTWPASVHSRPGGPDGGPTPPEGGNGRSASRREPDRARHAGPANAAVPVGVLREVLLMVVLSVVEGPGLADLGRD
jgi:hypothetical protein